MTAIDSAMPRIMKAGGDRFNGGAADSTEVRGMGVDTITPMSLRALAGVGVWMLPAVAAAQFVDHEAGVFAPIVEVHTDQIGGGAGFADVDGDGWDDVLIAHNGGGLSVYRNGGPLEGFSFTDVTAQSGLPQPPPEGIVGLAAGDLDGDGHVDLVLLSRRGAFLYAGSGDGTFRDATPAAFQGPAIRTGGAAIGDLDRDGYADVYVLGYTLGRPFPFHDCSPNQLYVNLGDLAMREVGEAAGVADDGCGLSALLFDQDGDGDLDIGVANDFGAFAGPNALYRNDGLGADGDVAFTSVGAEIGFADRMYGMGLAAADVNGDELPDVFATNIGRAVLLVSDGTAGFVDRSDDLGVAAPYSFEGWRIGWGTAFLDAANDGWSDLTMVAGQLDASLAVRAGPSQPNALYLDLGRPGSGARPDVGLDLGVGATDSGRGLAVGDFDRDGREDVLTAALGGDVHLYRNVTDGAPGVSLRLEGTASGADAIGAKVTLDCGGTRRVRWVGSSGSFMSRSSTLVTLPLGGCDGASPVATIRWPSGAVSRVELDEAGGAVDLREPAWLVLSPEWLPADGVSTAIATVRPPAGDGTELGPGHDVTIAAEALSVSPVTDHGDGSYSAVVTAPASRREPVRIEVAIDGAAVPHRPRLRFFERDRSVLAVEPTHRPGGEVAVWLRPMDEEGRERGSGLGPSLRLDVRNGVVVSGPTDLGDGTYVASVRASTGDAVVRAFLGDEQVGSDRASASMAPVDPDRTEISVFPGYVRSEEAAQTEAIITVYPRDPRGALTDSFADLEVELRGRGGELVEPMAIDFGTRSISIRIGAALLHDAGPIELRLDGIALGKRAEVIYWANRAELLAVVDPQSSLIGPYHQVVYSGGEDFGWIVAELRDSDGDVVPPPDDFEVFSGVGVPFDLDVTHEGRQLEAKVRTTYGEYVENVDVGWDGQRTGVVTTFAVRPHGPRDLARLSVELCASVREPRADGAATVTATIQPRDGRTDLLVGPDVPLEVSFASTAIPATYAEPGTYVATVGPFAEPAAGILSALLRTSGARAEVPLRFLADGEDPTTLEEPYCAVGRASDSAPDGDAGVQQDAGADGVDGGAEGEGRWHALGGCSTVPGGGSGGLVVAIAAWSLAARRKRATGREPVQRG
ncbi:MAG: VCBS repeat-containing protein [Deltaproteobacteria bacterium]|nr:VCBS repeat-containing protein [Deltaproteobacteria bacterium]